CPPLFVGFPESHQVLDTPEPICYASRHCWTHAKCTMDFYEVVGEIIQSHSGGMVLEFAGESIREPRVAPHVRPHRPILPLHERCAHVLWIRISAHGFQVATDALCGRVARLVFERSAINLVQLSVITLAAESI